MAFVSFILSFFQTICFFQCVCDVCKIHSICLFNTFHEDAKVQTREYRPISAYIECRLLWKYSVRYAVSEFLFKRARGSERVSNIRALVSVSLTLCDTRYAVRRDDPRALLYFSPCVYVCSLFPKKELPYCRNAARDYLIIESFIDMYDSRAIAITIR